MTILMTSLLGRFWTLHIIELQPISRMYNGTLSHQASDKTMKL